MATIPELQTALVEGRNLILVCDRRIFMMTAVDPTKPANAVSMKSLDKGSRFITKPSDVLVIGSVDASALPWATTSGSDDREAAPRPSTGLSYRLPDGTIVEPGTQVLLSNGKTATFLYWKPSRPKFPLEIEIGGKRFKATAGHIRSVLGATPKTLTPERKEALLRDLDGIENGLSPENLSCDGEASKTDMDRRYRDLKARERTIHAELGYKPTHEEIRAAGDRALAVRFGGAVHA